MLDLWRACAPNRKVKCDILNRDIVREKITVKKHGMKQALFWNTITIGRCFTYSIYDGSEMIHRSYVIHKCYKFAFMRSKDIEIGPCYTSEKWRGKNIYPFVLRTILENELKDGADAYMIIDEGNRSSQLGAAKAGFQKTAHVKRTKVFRRYHIMNKNE